MAQCVQVEVGVGGIVRHVGLPEDWQAILSSAARIRRLDDVVDGPYTALYEVVDAGNRCRRFLVAEELPGTRTGAVGRLIGVGSVVRVSEGGFEETWRIVDAAEADVTRRCISEASPLGRALLGHVVGDVVRVQGPEGCWPVRVMAVE